MPIFDQGYQHWQGPLAGHAWRWLAIARHGVRVQLKNRLLVFLLFAAWVPALLLVAAVAVWGLVEQKAEGVFRLAAFFLPQDVVTEPEQYRAAFWTVAYSYFFTYEMYFIMLLAVLAGPGLISRDLRFNALPLYFARPLTRLDYFLGKLGVIGALVAAVAVGPAVLAYVIGVCFSLDLTVLRDTWGVLLASVAYGLVITLSAGTLMLALSSLSRRSLYVGLTWFGLWWISAMVAFILGQIQRDARRRELHEKELAAWVDAHPPPAGVKMRGPFVESYAESGFVQGGDPRTETGRWHQRWQRANGEAWFRGHEGSARATANDWRPLLSYTANLERIGAGLLDTDAAWTKLGEPFEKVRQRDPRRNWYRGPDGPVLAPEPVDVRRPAEEHVPQYPWQWSAGVLAGLVGISVWTMSRRVKSLDRLR
jgi:hypothetical protein